MAHHKFFIFFCVFITLFSWTIRISYATVIRGGQLTGAVISGTAPTLTGPCVGQAVGYQIASGPICAGTYTYGTGKEWNYMVTPGGCQDSNCTIGNGGVDNQHMAWASHNMTYTPPNLISGHSVTTGADDYEDGKSNTLILTVTTPKTTFDNGQYVTSPPYYIDTKAAQWCTAMGASNYGGYNDWYLPSLAELFYVLYLNSTLCVTNSYGTCNSPHPLTGFASSLYWSSTESNTVSARRVNFTNGSQNNSVSKTNTNAYVRCVRRY
ncbi:MAG: DUF1566 domain-containing protein [Candidatus Omnitrophica bacterium]|nr:DUF1566 domain-containing protein [Candidatus Omnitrophota bacterium]